MERMREEMETAVNKFVDSITESLETILQEIRDGNYECAETDLWDLLGRI